MDKGGVAPSGIRLPSGGGAVAGIGSDFTTNLNTGVGSYAIPIDLPDGRRAQAPQLALQYSSAGPADAFGLGWTLGGLTIRRDAGDGVPAYDDSDDLLLGGQPLVPLGDNLYRPRVDPSMQRVRRLDAGWEVTDRQGTRHLLGLTEQAQEIRPADGGVLAWHVEQVVDTTGNATFYTYRRDGQRLYLHRIEYADVRFEVEYEPRPDPRTVRRGGYAQRTGWRARRLGLHRTSLSPSLFRAYDLSYDTDPLAGHSLLASVTLTGFRPAEPGEAGDLATESAPPLRFRYSAFDPARRVVHAMSGPDGDGPPPLGLTAELVDLEGFGLPGVLEATATTHRYWANRGGAAWGPPQRLRHFPEGVSLADRRVRLADVDGDARPDLILTNGALTGWYPGEAGAAWGAHRAARTGPAVDARDERVRIFDASGDGRADVVVAAGRALLRYAGQPGGGWSADPAVVTRRRDDPTFPDVAFDDPRVRLADMSGDGLWDIVRIWAGQLEVWPSLGTLRWDQRTILTLPGRPPARFDPRRMHILDVNGDGLADLAYVDVDEIVVWVNRGESMGDPVRIPYPTPAGGAARAADMLGTATTGLLLGASVRPGARDAHRFVDFTGGVKPYLLTTVDNGVGKVTTITYGSSSAHRRRDRDAGAEWGTHLPRAIQVVDRLDHVDSVSGSTASTEFRYHEGHYDPRSQAFAGFALVESQERHGAATAPVLTRSTFHVGLPGGAAVALRGLLRRRETLSPDGSAQAQRPYLVESTDWTVRVVATGTDGTDVLSAVPRRRSVRRSERGDTAAVTVTELEHDEYGNVVHERHLAQAPDRPDVRFEIAASYVSDPARWLLGLPVRRTTLVDGVVVDDLRYSYDGRPPGELRAGLLSRRERLAFPPGRLAEAFDGVQLPDLTTLGYRAEGGPGGEQWWFDEYQAEHDPAGNLVECRDGAGQVTQVSYDPAGLYPVGATNAAGQHYQAEYDPRLGAITRYVDPNGQETRYRYGPLGRVVAEIRPGDPDADPSVRFEYHASSAPVTTVMLRRRDGAAPRRSVTYYDGLGNEVQTRARQDDGTYFVTGRAVADQRGLVTELHPAFTSPDEAFDAAEGLAPERCHRTHFDALRRPVEVLDPAGRRARARFDSTRMEFSDTADTDPTSPWHDTPRVHEVDALGRLLRVIEETGTGAIATRYGYDGQGRLVSVVDAAGPLLSQAYDAAGRVLRIDHRDAGTRRFLRDARGRLVLYVDAEGRRVSWTFDPLGRVLTAAVDGNVVERFSYDAGAGDNLVGRLARAQDEHGAQTFSYDGQGRLVATTRTIEGVAQPFGYEFGYDVDSRRTLVRHPDGGQTSYGYDALGRVASVSGHIESVHYDEQGRRDRAVYAGGVLETRRYDEALGRLVEHALSDAGGADLLRLSLSYDQAGNVVRIDDPGGARRDFEYDALNRLVRAHGGPADQAYDHRFDYDDIGNLTRNDAWRPDPVQYTGARLVAAGTDTFGYDANGCLVSRPGMTLEYDARELLRRVRRDDGVVVDFGYDHTGRRIRKRVTGPEGVRDTLYIGESFEVAPDGTTLRYVTDPDGGATLVVRDGVPVRTLFHDHTGTVVAVHQAGTARRVHYTAYGARLGTEELGDILFAGKRFDAETGLYYVRMRYYDPVLGRFISPDPIAVTAAAAGRVRPLSLNPYVYALDNPLRFTDATGLWTFWEGFLTVVIVAAIVVAAAFTFGAAGVIALAVGAAVGAIIGGATTGSVDGALAGAMLGFGIVATVLGCLWVGGALGGAFGAAAFGSNVGAAVGGFSAGIQAFGFVPAVRQDAAYKDLLGYTSWVNPWTWPGHVVGALIFVFNAIVYAFAYLFTGGEPPEWADMDVTFEQGMIVTTGGTIRPARAFNFGAFTSLNPNDPAVANPTDRELILRHERGHSLNNAYFGILQVGRIGAGEQTESFWEQMAESNVNPFDPSLTSDDKDGRRRSGGRGFGDVPWWNA